MFLHLGSDIVVALIDIVSINDYKSFRSVVNREFIKKMKSKNFIIDISENDPKSFVVTKSKVYLSAISSLTLKKRADTLFYNEE
jgi:extracellular matrix regulatory protein B